MIFFYWLVAVMTLDQHWLWGREILGQFTIIKLLGILCLLIALFKLVVGNAPLRRLYEKPPTRWLIALLILFSAGATHSLPAVVSTAYQHVLSILVLWVTVVTLVGSVPRLRWTVLLAVGSAALASLYTLRQQLTVGIGDPGFRAAGIFSDSNQYALVVGLWIPIAVLWTFSKRPTWERVFCFGSLIVSLLGTLLAASRGGFVGLTAAFLYLGIRSPRLLRKVAVVGALMIPLLVWSSSSLLTRVRNPSEGDQQAQQARLIVWKAGLRMIEAHPLIGVGMHNFKSQVLRYEDESERVESLAHNSYVEIAAEMGIPTLIAFVGLLGATLTALERVRKRSQHLKSEQLSLTALGLQAGLISFMFSSFFLSAWFEKMVWLMIFLSIALYRISCELGLFRSKTSLRLKRRELATIAPPETV